MTTRSSWGVALVGAVALAAATMVSTVAGAAPVKKGAAKTAAAPRAKPGATRAQAKKASKALAGETVGGDAHAKKRRGSGATASTAAQQKHRRAGAAAKPEKKRGPCLHDAIELSRGFNRVEIETLPLTRCDGRPAPLAVEKMSVLVRPMTVRRPTIPATPALHVSKSASKSAPKNVRDEWAPGVKLIDPGLVTRLQKVLDHFHVKHVTVVSGYRPTSFGSFHQSARALDFHLDGVSNVDLVAYCRTLKDTGCGYYPNSSFVHMDVRPRGTGHVYWIDASGPGEPAQYVSTWPPKETPEPRAAAAEPPRPDPAAPSDENTNGDGIPELPPSASDAKVDATTVPPDATGLGLDQRIAP